MKGYWKQGNSSEFDPINFDWSAYRVLSAVPYQISSEPDWEGETSAVAFEQAPMSMIIINELSLWAGNLNFTDVTLQSNGAFGYDTLSPIIGTSYNRQTAGHYGAPEYVGNYYDGTVTLIYGPETRNNIDRGYGLMAPVILKRYTVGDWEGDTLPPVEHLTVDLPTTTSTKETWKFNRHYQSYGSETESEPDDEHMSGDNVRLYTPLLVDATPYGGYELEYSLLFGQWSNWHCISMIYQGIVGQADQEFWPRNSNYPTTVTLNRGINCTPFAEITQGETDVTVQQIANTYDNLPSFYHRPSDLENISVHVGYRVLWVPYPITAFRIGTQTLIWRA